MVIKRFDIMSVAKMSGVFYAAMGLIGGIFLFFFGFLIESLPFEGREFPTGLGMLFGVGGIFFLPLFYGVIGFLGGALMAWVYNVFSQFMGGIEVEVEDSKAINQ